MKSTPLLLLCAVLLAFGLGACGKKGDLYLPPASDQNQTK